MLGSGDRRCWYRVTVDDVTPGALNLDALYSQYSDIVEISCHLFKCRDHSLAPWARRCWFIETEDVGIGIRFMTVPGDRRCWYGGIEDVVTAGPKML